MTQVTNVNVLWDILDGRVTAICSDLTPYDIDDYWVDEDTYECVLNVYIPVDKPISSFKQDVLTTSNYHVSSDFSHSNTIHTIRFKVFI